MIVNKDNYKDRPELYLILVSLEKAIENNDDFSIACLLTRLEALKLKIACADDETVVQ
jgi:hypothetical protein